MGHVIEGEAEDVRDVMLLIGFGFQVLISSVCPLLGFCGMSLFPFDNFTFPLSLLKFICVVFSTCNQKRLD